MPTPEAGSATVIRGEEKVCALGGGCFIRGWAEVSEKCFCSLSKFALSFICWSVQLTCYFVAVPTGLDRAATCYLDIADHIHRESAVFAANYLDNEVGVCSTMDRSCLKDVTVVKAVRHALLVTSWLDLT